MKRLMAANWKMHKTREEAKETASLLVKMVADRLDGDREVLIIPSYTSLEVVWEQIREQEGFSLGAQNFYPAKEGAFTGEVSPGMLMDVGCSYVLVGHSERRHIMGEDEELISRKVSFGLDVGLNVILCIGETLSQRRASKVEEVIVSQLTSALDPLEKDMDISHRLSIAYEPVWAIGTGEVAGEKEIREAHALIREELIRSFGERGKEVRILYGGSVKPDNASRIIGIDNVDGVLVGGASLNAKDFSEIILA